jgi:hypothetical protein
MGGRGSQSASFAAEISYPELNPRGHVKNVFGDRTQRDIDKGHEYIASELGVSLEKASNLDAAVKAYTGPLYDEILEAQVNPNPQTKREKLLKAISNGLEEYVERAPAWNGGTTYRGFTIKDRALFDNYSVGDVIDNRGRLSSWSSNVDIAKQFANFSSNTQMSVIFVSKTQSMGTSIRHISRCWTEDEVLVSKNASFKITKIKHDKKLNSKIIYVDEM